MDPKTRIALDVMGGDDAPSCNLDGALSAIQAGLDPARVLLVGDRAAIEAGLEERGGQHEGGVEGRLEGGEPHGGLLLVGVRACDEDTAHGVVARRSRCC